jgi:hypothetical protein
MLRGIVQATPRHLAARCHSASKRPARPESTKRQRVIRGAVQKPCHAGKAQPIARYHFALVFGKTKQLC